MSGLRTELRAELPSDLRAPERGRALVERLLLDASDDRAWDAEVLVSEVLTNAVIHGQPDDDEPVRLLAEADDGRLRVEVQDNGPGIEEPTGELPSPSATTGRGLALVVGLSDRWGVARMPSRVWFELDLARPEPSREG